LRLTDVLPELDWRVDIPVFLFAWRVEVRTPSFLPDEDLVAELLTDELRDELRVASYRLDERVLAVLPELYLLEVEVRELAYRDDERDVERPYLL